MTYYANFKTQKISSLAILAGGISGIMTVFLSTGYLEQFPHGTVVLPWSFPKECILFFILSGVLLFLGIITMPKRFWGVLVATSVLTGGMFVLRYPIFDEWLVGWIVLGGLVAALRGSIPNRSNLGVHGPWVFLFLTLCFYLTILSFLGFFIWENPKALRFVMLFGMLFALGFLLSKYDFPLLNPKEITLLIVRISFLYYLIYIVHGLVFPKLIYVNIMEGIGGAGSGYHNVIGVVAAPASLILIGKYKESKFLGWIVLFLGLLVSALADSRGGFFILLTAVLVSPFAIGFIRTTKIIGIGVIASVLIGTILFSRPQWGLDIGEGIVKALFLESGTSTYDYFGREVTVAKGDAGRFMYVRGAMEALINVNPILALSGVGVYGYFPVAGPYFEKVASDFGIPTSNVNYGTIIGGKIEPPRPPALGALIIETGIIGTSLLFLCAFSAIAVTLFRKSNSGKTKIIFGPNLLVSTSVGLAFFWAYLGEAQDIIFLYLLVMPFGLVHGWSKIYREAKYFLSLN